MVPVAVILSVFFEAPTILELSADGNGGVAPPVEVAEPAAAKAEFGKAVPEGFGSGSMFDRIAVVYDVTNWWMTLGLDQYWRKTMVQECLRLESGDRVLDLATGTADVSLLVGAKLQELGSEGQVVLGLDPSVEMLRRGVSKAETRGLNRTVRLVKGDAQDLSQVQDVTAEGQVADSFGGVDTGSVDKISMSFGIRNVPDRPKAFREMRRVLRSPSSRVCILEFSLPDGEKLLSKVAKAFITHVVPFIGRIATGNTGSKDYEYLERSILKFPRPVDFAASMTQEGLRVKSITSFAYGAVHLYAASPVGA